MSGDQRRDRPKPGASSHSSSPQQRGSPPREVIASGGSDRARAGESEPPTRPRGRTITDSELPTELHVSVSTPALCTPQDSLHPVRVSARTVRPPLSLWTRAWATMALVIVVAGGAIGIVTSLRVRTLGTARGARGDGSQAASAQRAPEHGVEAKEAAKGMGPAAVPGFAAPPPLVPSPALSRSAASPVESVAAPPIESSPGTAAVRASASAGVFRTPESLAVSLPGAPSAAPSLSRRTKPTEITTPPQMEMKRPPEESAHEPTPAPAASATPETKGESEAWVTEERRF
jgi:hypothetical protein